MNERGRGMHAILFLDMRVVLPLHRPSVGLRLVCSHEARHYVQRRHLRWINLAHLHHRWSPADHREFHGKQADADELRV